MHRDTIVGITALLVILGGIALYAAMKPLPAGAPGITAETVVLPEGGYSEHAAYYDIAANYATSTPLAGSANAVAVERMESFVADTITQFKADGNFATLTQEDITLMGLDQGRKAALNIVYLISSSPRTVSYIFTIYMDTLGAHGNTFFHTFTFDIASGALLALGDVFLPGTDYLAELSKLARAKLPDIIGPGTDARMLMDGTVPAEESFENFFLDNGDFVILFAPYQVAAYAAGPQTLRISLSELSGMLKSEYR